MIPKKVAYASMIIIFLFALISCGGTEPLMTTATAQLLTKTSAPPATLIPPQ